MSVPWAPVLVPSVIVPSSSVLVVGMACVIVSAVVVVADKGYIFVAGVGILASCWWTGVGHSWLDWAMILAVVEVLPPGLLKQRIMRIHSMHVHFLFCHSCPK